jgi:hypothetical protein
VCCWQHNGFETFELLLFSESTRLLEWKPLGVQELIQVQQFHLLLTIAFAWWDAKLVLRTSVLDF